MIAMSHFMQSASGVPSPDSRTRAARARRRAVPTLAAIAVVAGTVMLGNWQVGRAHEKERMQQVRDAAQRAEPVAVGAAPLDADSIRGRHVSLRGSFEASRTIFLDNRTHGGVAGFHVFTALRVAGSDLHVLVLRGWVAGDPRERTRLPEVRTPAGEVQVDGVAESDPAAAIELAQIGPPGPGERIWQNVSVERFARWSSLPMQPFVVRESARPDAGDGLVRDWVRPGDDVQKHRAYAFQWYLLSAITVALWIRFVLLAGRRKPENT
jgi:surfeit locus 1 family protein